MTRSILIKKHIRGFVCAFVMLFCIGILTQNAKAQWTVWVAGDTSLTTLEQLQLQTQQLGVQTKALFNGEKSSIQDYVHYAKEVQQWVEVLNQYATMIEQNVKKFTSLKGILGVVEKQLGLSDDTLKALADLGQAIRATIQLKDQFIGMVRTRLAMIKNLDDRARKGIFDPNADLADLEEYLTQTMGRQAQARLQTSAKIAEQDAEMERLTNQLETIRANRAAAEKERLDVEAKLKKESELSSRPRSISVGEDGATVQTENNGRSSLSIDATNTLIIRKGQLDQLIADLSKEEQELMDKIAKKYQEYQARFDQVYFTGEKWREATDGWLEFTEKKNTNLGRIIDQYGNSDLTSRPKTAPSPNN